MVRSSIWVTAISLLGSALGFANQLLMAYRFGASRIVDTFLIALSVPTFVGGLASAIVSFSVVPRIVSASADKQAHAAYVKAMALAVAAICTAIVLTGWAMTPLFARIGGAEFAGASTWSMARIAWTAAAIQIAVAYLGAVCNAGGRFVVPALAGLAPYAGMLGANLWLGARHGIVVLPIGLVAGTLAAMAYLAFSVRNSLFARTCVPLPWREVRSFLASSPLTAVAMTIFSVYAVIDARLAPQLGEANLAYLGYSQRIVIALGNLAVAGPSAVLVPHFARAIAEGRRAQFVRDTYRALAVVGGIAVAVAIVTRIFSDDLISLAFRRGAFDANAAKQVANVLSVMVLGMVPMLSVVTLFRAIFCLGSARFPALASLLWALLYTGAASVLAPRFRAVGMAYAYVFAWSAVLAVGLAWFSTAVRRSPPGAT
jgi:putative peptidoglycan lipid II flippase